MNPYQTLFSQVCTGNRCQPTEVYRNGFFCQPGSVAPGNEQLRVRLPLHPEYPDYQCSGRYQLSTLYFFKANTADTLYQFSWNGSSYEFGHNSIPELTLLNGPTDADASSFSMLHSGGNYHAYLRKLGDPERLYQFVWQPGTNKYEWNVAPWLPELPVTGFPDDVDWSRWQMLHDGQNYRIYAFGCGSNEQIYQGAWNPSAGAYQYGYRSIDVLDLVGYPSTSDVGGPAMLHDGSDYRFYFQTL